VAPLVRHSLSASSPVATDGDGEDAAAAEPPALDLPEKVTGEAGDFIEVPARTNGQSVRWVPMTSGLRVFPPTLLKDTRTAVVTAKANGTYRLLAYTALGDVPSDPDICLVVVGKADPDDGDDEDDGKVDPDEEDEDDEPPPKVVPFPADGLHVLVVYESSDMNRLTGEQRAIIQGADVRAALDAAAPGRYRIYDKDADLQFVPQVWKDAMAVPRQSVPWVALSNGKTGYSGPLDMTAAQFLALLAEHK
jgi:hypothetical protein